MRKFKPIIVDAIYLITIYLLGVLGLIFLSLYVNSSPNSFVYNNIKLILFSVEVVLVLSTIILYALYLFNRGILFKIISVFLVLLDLCLILLYVINKTGILDKISTKDELRNFIQSFGGGAVFIFILIQFSQVVFLPIPSFITVGAGALLFGPLRASIYSSIGIVIGSIVSFLIGKKFGYKVVSCIVGKKNLDRVIDLTRNKDKILFTFMFLLPFFPDDVLCFVAGITSMSFRFFIVMIILTRTISVFASTYSLSNSLIPYNTWWGILVWILIFILIILLIKTIFKKENYKTYKTLEK